MNTHLNMYMPYTNAHITLNIHPLRERTKKKKNVATSEKRVRESSCDDDDVVELIRKAVKKNNLNDPLFK